MTPERPAEDEKPADRVTHDLCETLRADLDEARKLLAELAVAVEELDELSQPEAAGEPRPGPR
jgi:hypothetical protein